MTPYLVTYTYVDSLSSSTYPISWLMNADSNSEILSVSDMVSMNPPVYLPWSSISHTIPIRFDDLDCSVLSIGFHNRDCFVLPMLSIGSDDWGCLMLSISFNNWDWCMRSPILVFVSVTRYSIIMDVAFVIEATQRYFVYFIASKLMRFASYCFHLMAWLFFI